MAPSVLPWLLAALFALSGGLAMLFLASRLPPEARGRLRHGISAGVAAALILGAGWLVAAGTVWPGNPFSLALLALGALLGGWLLAARPGGEVDRAVFGLNLVGVAALIGVAVLLVSGSDSPATAAVTWVLSARIVLAGIGAGVWLPVTLASVRFALKAARQEDATLDASSQSGRAADPGRFPAVLGYPFLTTALVAAVLWNVQAYAAAWRTALPDLWLLVTWLLGAAYLHATSPWRPLGLPAWFPSLIAAGAFGSAVLSALSAAALLVG